MLLKLFSYSDDKIVEIIQKGDRNECNKVVSYLYKQHYKKVRAYILKNKGEESEVEDIFQEAIMLFYNQVEDNKFKGKSSIGTYLFVIARNLWLTEVKKRGRATHVEIPDNHVVDEYTIEDMLADRSSNQLLINLFTKLGEGCKQILSLSYFEEHSVKELQKLLSLGSEQAVRTKKFRCLQKLIGIFEENEITRDHFSF